MLNLIKYLLFSFLFFHLSLCEDETTAPEVQSKIIKSTLTTVMGDEAMKLAEGLLLKYSNIETALDQVAVTFKKSYPGNWYCFRSGKYILKTKLIKDTQSYALINVPPIDVLLINIAISGSGGANVGDDGDTGTGDQTSSLSELDMIKSTRKIIDDNNELKIFQNKLSNNEKEEAIFAAKWSINNLESFGEIEQTMKDTMESKFKGEWRCFVMCYDSDASSTTGAGIINARTNQKNIEPIIYFGIGKVKMVLYKPIINKQDNKLIKDEKEKVVVVEREPSELEIIERARLNLNKVEVNSTDMNVASQQVVIQVVKQGIMTYDSYDGIAKYCRDSFDISYGKSWECIIGRNLQFWIWTWYRRPFFMNFKIDNIRAIVLKQLG